MFFLASGRHICAPESLLFLVGTETWNKPKAAETTQNRPKPAKTTYNTSQNDQKPSTIYLN